MISITGPSGFRLSAGDMPGSHPSRQGHTKFPPSSASAAEAVKLAGSPIFKAQMADMRWTQQRLTGERDALWQQLKQTQADEKALQQQLAQIATTTAHHAQVWELRGYEGQLKQQIAEEKQAGVPGTQRSLPLIGAIPTCRHTAHTLQLSAAVLAQWNQDQAWALDRRRQRWVRGRSRSLYGKVSRNSVDSWAAAVAQATADDADADADADVGVGELAVATAPRAQTPPSLAAVPDSSEPGFKASASIINNSSAPGRVPASLTIPAQSYELPQPLVTVTVSADPAKQNRANRRTHRPCLSVVVEAEEEDEMAALQRLLDTEPKVEVIPSDDIEAEHAVAKVVEAEEEDEMAALQHLLDTEPKVEVIPSDDAEAEHAVAEVVEAEEEDEMAALKHLLDTEPKVEVIPSDDTEAEHAVAEVVEAEEEDEMAALKHLLDTVVDNGEVWHPATAHRHGHTQQRSMSAMVADIKNANDARRAIESHF